MKAITNRFIVVLLILCSINLSSCGFRLRGAVDLPPEMKMIWVEGVPGSQLLGSLRETLLFAGGSVTNDRKSAGMVLNVLEDRMERRQVSLFDTGKANEFELTYSLTYELLDLDGKIITPRQTIQVVKDYFNEQINVIGKSQEEDVIRSEMYKEAVRSLIRRTGVALGRI